MANDGGPAFPAETVELPSTPRLEATRIYYTGMTLRDWFAGQALQGLLADPGRLLGGSSVAITAYEYADLMLEKRG